MTTLTELRRRAARLYLLWPGKGRHWRLLGGAALPQPPPATSAGNCILSPIDQVEVQNQMQHSRRPTLLLCMARQSTAPLLRRRQRRTSLGRGGRAIHVKVHPIIPASVGIRIRARWPFTFRNPLVSAKPCCSHLARVAPIRVLRGMREVVPHLRFFISFSNRRRRWDSTSLVDRHPERARNLAALQESVKI